MAQAAPTVSPPAELDKPKKKRRKRNDDPLGTRAHEQRYAAQSTSGTYLNSDRARQDPQTGAKARFDKARTASQAAWTPIFDDEEDTTTPVKKRLGKNAAKRRHAIQYFYEHIFGAPEEDPEVWDGHDGVVHAIMRAIDAPDGSRDCVRKVMVECAAALAEGVAYDVRGAEHSQRGRDVLISEDSDEARIIFDVRDS